MIDYGAESAICHYCLFFNGNKNVQSNRIKKYRTYMKISNDDNFDTYFGQYCAVLARCHQIQPVQPCILHAQCQVTVSSSLISYESVKHQSLNKSQTCTLLSLLSTCHYVWSSIN